MPAFTPRYPADLGVARKTQMLPVSFDGCFGWLHTGLDGRAARVAVLLCPGLKTDAVTGHRSFRLLANALAKAGYPTLRFDYPGTGDSCDPEAAEYWVLWQQSIHRAADWLCYHTGADQVALCGLRFGATLAAAVAEKRADVAGLILLAPILRGRSYLRQLSMEAQNQSSTQPGGAGLTSHELQLSVETVRLINRVDLRRVVLRCHVAVYSQAKSPVLAECSAFWRSCGAEVTCNDFAGLEPMLRPGFLSHEAPVNVSQIVTWLRARVPADPAPPGTVSVPPSAELQAAGCIETPLQFGTDRNLFGMLCRPAGWTKAELAVVICNPGGDPHYGGARVSVGLARGLAAEGIASLRIDFAGLGDSIAPDDAETHVYETDRRSDVSTAIDALHALGYRRFAIQGLCAGAFHALHAALADSRISVLLLVNLPLFQWRTGQPIELLSYKTQTMSQFLRRLRRITVRRSALHAGVGLRARFVMQAAWLVDNTKRALWRLFGLLSFAAPKSFAQASMDRLSERARILFLYSEGDQGLVMFAQEFGRGSLPRAASIQIVPGLDHSLRGAEMQRIAAKHLIAFLAAEPPDCRAPNRAVPALMSGISAQGSAI